MHAGKPRRCYPWIFRVQEKLELISGFDYKLRGNVDADRYVFAVVLTIGDVGGGVDFEFALDLCSCSYRCGRSLIWGWGFFRVYPHRILGFSPD